MDAYLGGHAAGGLTCWATHARDMRALCELPADSPAPLRLARPWRGVVACAPPQGKQPALAVLTPPAGSTSVTSTSVDVCVHDTFCASGTACHARRAAWVRASGALSHTTLRAGAGWVRMRKQGPLLVEGSRELMALTVTITAWTVAWGTAGAMASSHSQASSFEVHARGESGCRCTSAHPHRTLPRPQLPLLPPEGGERPGAHVPGQLPGAACHVHACSPAGLQEAAAAAEWQQARLALLGRWREAAGHLPAEPPAA